MSQAAVGRVLRSATIRATSMYILTIRTMLEVAAAGNGQSDQQTAIPTATEKGRR